VAAVQDHNAIRAFPFLKEHLGGSKRPDDSDGIVVSQSRWAKIAERQAMDEAANGANRGGRLSGR